MDTVENIVIVGAGFAGLATAIGLHRCAHFFSFVLFNFNFYKKFYLTIFFFTKNYTISPSHKIKLKNNT